MPLLVYNGISVSLLTRHCAVFLDQCHCKSVNDLVLEMKRIFPPCLYNLRLLTMSHTVFCLCALVYKAYMVKLEFDLTLIAPAMRRTHSLYRKTIA